MIFLISLVIISFALFMLFYGGYYILRPSERGKNIVKNLNIPYPTVIAHRGASNIAPESSKPAFNEAINMGADYLEADIHRTKDGKLVIIHDSNLKRTSNVKSVYPNRANDHVSTFTYSELLTLDFGSWFNQKYPHKSEKKYNFLQIVTLEELIDLAKSSARSPGLVLDLKETGKYPGLAEDVLALLKRKNWYPPQNEEKANIIIFSFNLDILKRFKQLAPEIPRTLLLDENMINKRNWSRWLELAEGNVNGLGVKGFVSWPWYIALAHDRNLFVFPYVINKVWQLKILSHIKSNGYITNRPGVVRKFLDLIPKPLLLSSADQGPVAKGPADP